MPDFVDKVFDYTTYVVQGTASVLQDGYSISKDAIQQTYDVSKNIGGTMVTGAKVVYGKVQDNVPSDIPLIVGLSTASPQPPPPSQVTVSGLIYDKFTGFISKNISSIGLGVSIPTIGYTAYQIYSYHIPYERHAKRLKSRYRYEVVLVIGSMNSTFVSKLVSDLNMRGYVVFVTVSDEKELKIVEEINDTDVRPLFVDFTNDSSVRSSLLKLGQFLDSRIENISEESYYNFKGVLAIPDYTRLPKLKNLKELNAREYLRVTESFFLKFNSLLYNGILSFIRESNSRREVVENYNEQKIKGGYAKLLFINFLIIPSNDNRRLVHNLSLETNKLFYDILYQENSVSFKESAYRTLGSCCDPSMIDMSSLDITLHKNNSSTLVSEYPMVQNVLSYCNRKMSPKDIHHKIYDLLNQQWLRKRYVMEN
ncbi:hypothetical protein PMKS-001441 [Pichia membranifaciens]|uniref:Uncharacterized protein n=1 Tax=Pichia membranifaciens TaxID=4926 RepID=A0A1Q2YF00_9ASCO|nr:hypothetical protein PMKS-001441 [Pichia membranifaciens]